MQSFFESVSPKGSRFVTMDSREQDTDAAGRRGGWR